MRTPRDCILSGDVARACALVLGLGLAACTGRPTGDASCLPPARASDEPEAFEVADGPGPLWWYCEAPPPAELLDGSYRVELIWVEGETCDPCDRETIAARALAQVREPEGPPAPRLLCGPVPHPLQPWDRQGCVYAVASAGGWVD